MKQIEISPQKPLLVVFVPGFGVAVESEHNLISRSDIPFLRQLIKDYPSLALTGTASGQTKPLWTDFFGQPGQAGLLSAVMERHDSRFWLDSFALPALARFADLGESNSRLFSLADSSLEAFKKQLQNMQKEVFKGLKSESAAVYIWVWSGLDRAALLADDAEEVLQLLNLFDRVLKKIFRSQNARQGSLLFTSPYGRCEAWQDLRTETPDRGIKSNPVPLVLAHADLLGIDPGWGSISQGDFSLLSVKELDQSIIVDINKIII